MVPEQKSQTEERLGGDEGQREDCGGSEMEIDNFIWDFNVHSIHVKGVFLRFNSLLSYWVT